MNFPLELPIFRFLYWLVNTPGIGAAVIGLLVGTALFSFVRTMHWIAEGKREEEEALPYPPLH